jgi:hypothetical protein
LSKVANAFEIGAKRNFAMLRIASGARVSGQFVSNASVSGDKKNAALLDRVLWRFDGSRSP